MVGKRRSRRLIQLLLNLREDQWIYVIDLQAAAKIPMFLGGSIYPFLTQLEVDGYLESRWDDTPQSSGRQRRQYRLTSDGREHFSSQIVIAP